MTEHDPTDPFDLEPAPLLCDYVPGRSPAPPAVNEAVRGDRTAAPAAPVCKKLSLGRSLVRSGGPVLRELFSQILMFESLHRKDDFDVPAILTGRTVEAALRTWLVEPLAVRQYHDRKGLLDELEPLVGRWPTADQKFYWNTLNSLRIKPRKAMLGDARNLLELLQAYAREHGALPARLRAGFLGAFTDECRDWLLTVHLQATLGEITRIRNETAHAKMKDGATSDTRYVPLGEAGYRTLMHAAVAHSTFHDWFNYGPAATPGTASGFLHQLLAGLRENENKGSDDVCVLFDQLPDLVRGEELAVVVIDHDTRSPGDVRGGIEVSSEPVARPFRLNDPVYLRVTAARPVWVRLFACDPMDGFDLLWPNGPDEEPVTPDRPLTVPTPGLYVRLNGDPGERWVVACVSETPFAADDPAANWRGPRKATPEELLAHIAPCGRSVVGVRYAVLP